MSTHEWWSNEELELDQALNNVLKNTFKPVEEETKRKFIGSGEDVCLEELMSEGY